MLSFDLTLFFCSFCNKHSIYIDYCYCMCMKFKVMDALQKKKASLRNKTLLNKNKLVGHGHKNRITVFYKEVYLIEKNQFSFM